MQQQAQPNTVTGRTGEWSWARLVLPAVLIGATVAVYANSLDGAMLFDDHRTLTNNVRIRDLSSPWTVLSGRRPTLDLSLALNYAVGRLDLTGLHIGNIAIHALAALVLFGLLRRIMDSSAPGGGATRTTGLLAFAATLLWTVHPIQTQSVTYIIQRSESLMGLFYLAMLYCLLRGVDSARSGLWFTVSVLCCGLGMGSKGVMVTAPVVALLFDRAFVSGSFLESIRRRWALYVALGTTWAVLIVTDVGPGVLSTGRAKATAGFSLQGIGPWDYAMTQAGVVAHYLRLSLWPEPLCLDYEWPLASTFLSIGPPLLFVSACLLVTLLAWARAPRLGFAGVWLFVILAPTSTIVPIRDPLFEHRMYLPLATVSVLIVLGMDAMLRLVSRRVVGAELAGRYVGLVLVILAAVALGAGTARRNQAYGSSLGMWLDIVAKRTGSFRAHYNLGKEYLDREDGAAAVMALREAIHLKPESREAIYNLGKALAQQGRLEPAARQFVAVLKIDPKFAPAYNDLGNVSVRARRVEEAIRYYRKAIEVNPTYPRSHFNLGQVLRGLGRSEAAIASLREAARLSPKSARVHFALGDALRATGDTDGARAEYRVTLALEPGHQRAQKALDELAAGPK